MAAPLLDAPLARAYRRCADDLRRVFADRYVALVAGGPSSAVAFARDIQPGDLEALSALAEAWHRDGLPAPVVMTPDEFRRSLDTFPAEYQALLDRHVVIDGDSPLAGAAVNPDDLRRACEAQARGHLIHLRQGWIEAGAHEHGLADLLVRSAAPLRSLLSNLARLHGDAPTDDAALASFAGRVPQLSEPLVTAVLALTQAPHSARALVSRLPDYLDASERLWAFIDRWRSR